MANFRPSDVVLSVFPLGDTLGRSELVIWTLQRNGDIWRRVWRGEVEACLRVDALSGVEPIRSWCRNPFFRPDLAGLHARHFAIVTDHTVELTELALLPIGQRWLRKRGA